MKTTSLEQAARTALQECLEQIPFLQIERIDRPNNSDGTDFQVRINNQGKPHWLLVEVKNNGQPRFARLAVYQLKERLGRQEDSYGVFIAPFISSEAARICEQAGIGCLDLAGNCLLSFDTIYIRQSGAPNPKPQKRELRSLYSPKAERVLRVLLDSPQRAWKVSELAQAAGVSLGLAANVKQRLLDREWIRTSADGIRLIKPAQLLDEWAQAYNFERNQVKEYYAMADILEIEGQLAETCQRIGLQYALSGFSSAAQLAPMVRYQKASAYINGEADLLIRELNWKPVTTGANISLLIPYDEGVFYGSEANDGIVITSPVQTFLDLQSQRGRGQEAAQAVRKVMEKSW